MPTSAHTGRSGLASAALWPALPLGSSEAGPALALWPLLVVGALAAGFVLWRVRAGRQPREAHARQPDSVPPTQPATAPVEPLPGPAPAPLRAVLERAAGARPRLLIAEDNAVNQLVACRLLERLGGEVRVAGSGVETVALQTRERFDLIFMDCAMPEVDGFEATRRIRAWERAAGAAPVPIVAMTANVMPGITEACVDAGMDDYVSKPVTLAALERTLARWCPQVGRPG